MELKHGNLTRIQIKTYVDGNGFFRRSTRISTLEKTINNVIREKMNIKNSGLDFIRYKQLK